MTPRKKPKPLDGRTLRWCRRMLLREARLLIDGDAADSLRLMADAVYMPPTVAAEWERLMNPKRKARRR